MANPGIGSKFVSVNLNKSYGQPANVASSSSYGSARVRPGSHGGGGGMVVLSRPRSSQKTGSKLSVPPPLNLPSLRKEHERFDSSGPGGAQAGGGSSGSGSRPSSSGMGWTKPGAIALQEKDDRDDRAPNGKLGGETFGKESVHGALQTVDGISRAGGAYMPPSARAVPASVHVSSAPVLSVEKAVVLRGEDFPSLQASIPAASGTTQRQKDSIQTKQKHGIESIYENRDRSQHSALIHTRPDVMSSHHGVGNVLNGNSGQSHGLGSHMEQNRKHEDYFSGPLPLVHFSPRSDWADDERDTSHGFVDRGRDHSDSKSEAYWDRDFDMPRGGILPHKSTQNVLSRWGQRDDGTSKVSSGELKKLDSYSSDIRSVSRDGPEGNSWRSSNPQKEGSYVQETVVDRAGIGAKPTNFSGVAGNRDPAFGRRDIGYGQGGRQQWSQMIEPESSWGDEKNKRFGNEQFNNRYRGDAFQNSSGSKSALSLGVKGLSTNDHITHFSKEKRPFSKNEISYLEDPYGKDFASAGFDGHDPFSAGLVGVMKRKKDVIREADFHDPVRESFEAELERVQKMQEQERQRAIEEQERALELARREEEERTRVAREQEERQRRLEEEAKEAAWRAEQERLEAIQRAEEQRVAREEEKQRIFMEEERRKQAAKQKLLELEAKIAKRQAEEAKSDNSYQVARDESMPGMTKEKDIRVADMADWEDGERMVERITTSASSDSSTLSRPFGVGSGSQFSKDCSTAFPDRGKAVNMWRRDVFENEDSSLSQQDQGNGLQSPRKDGTFGGKAMSRKEVNGVGGFFSSRNPWKGGIPDSHMDDFSQFKEQRWNLPGDADHYNRNTDTDPEFHEHFVEKSGTDGWSQGLARGNPYATYPEPAYHNSDANSLYSSGRSRYSLRQPRVLPPPSLSSVHKMPIRGDQHPGPSALINDMQYNYGTRNESPMQKGYGSNYQERRERSDIVDAHDSKSRPVNHSLDRNATPGCDSQSSLSVSSPPNSPPHLSHDDLDESGDSPMLSAAAEGKDVSLQGTLNGETGIETTRLRASSIVSTGDDEEWAIQNNEQLQEQEEYDEDDDAYQEEEEVHEADEDNIDLTQDFEDMHLEESGSAIDNLVLGFDDGVGVGLPSIECERSSRKEDVYVMQQATVGAAEEQGVFDRTHDDDRGMEPDTSSPLGSFDSSARKVQETEKCAQDPVIQPANTTRPSAASDVMGSVDISSTAGISTQSPILSSANMSLHSSGLTVLPAISAPNQAELPVKLQFGLFSGPSLIPSPVPAIQIGSIQMPLHLHPQVGPSISHLHPSQPPLFQFGQLRYTSPISQGIVPMAPQPMSYLQPNVPAHFAVNQAPGAPLPIQNAQDLVNPNPKKGSNFPSSRNDHSGLVPGLLDPSEKVFSEEKSALPGKRSGEDDRNSKVGTQVEEQGHSDRAVNASVPYSKKAEGILRAEASSSASLARERNFSGSNPKSFMPGGRARKFINVRNSGSRSSFPAHEVSRNDSNGFQRKHRRNFPRTEFRVRENSDRKQLTGSITSSNPGLDDKSSISGRVSLRSGSKRVFVPNKLPKQLADSNYTSSRPSDFRENETGSKVVKGSGKESLKNQNNSHPGEGSLKKNISAEEDAEAPLQSGVVRVFEQPGIEVPSDEDDFIEVRSKRQMLNDRREQREKEIKAKARVPQMPRKVRSATQNTTVSTTKPKISSVGEVGSTHSEYVRKETRGLGEAEVSSGFNSAIVSQVLAPIGTPPLVSDSQADMTSHSTKLLQTSPLGGKSLGPNLVHEAEDKVIDNVPTSLGSWGSSRTTQQVMPLTQSQLDEAMKPARFETHASPVGDHSVSASDPSSIPSSSMLAKDKSFSSTASPINSLLAGEKIQFGAVTSPTILPPSSRIVSHGIGPPCSSRSEIQMPPSLSASETECNLLDASCVHLEDCEAEAEAAASAVAVAAISNDETVGNGLGTCSVMDSKSFGSRDVDGVTTAGVAVNPQSSQTRSEESLSVALPADLSVETPPMSLWPPLPSPQNSSGQMLSHFPGGPPSHFPFYDMNPMLGAPIFAFGPHEESTSSTQSQPTKSSTSGSASLGSWQHHSGVDSFYGPPAGFSGPFISPPGGIPGVQGPPHMVVYNHFAPVGQYGQVGLSFMGTTYIPSGKQPDWKHNPTTNAVGVGEGDLNSINLVNSQRSPSNVPASVQHLAPGSQLLPMASPLAMFDVSPFQACPDMPVQARWSHLSAAPLHPVSLSLPLQQQPDSVLRSPFSNGPPVEQSLTASRFSESRKSTAATADGSRNFKVASDADVTKFPDELGLVEPSVSASAGPSAQTAMTKTSSGNSVIDGGKAAPRITNGATVSCQTRSSNFRVQSSQQKNVSGQQFHNVPAYHYQRGGGGSHKNMGAEWSHRRMGFQGRNQAGGEKSIAPGKVKQVYVAKQTSSGASNAPRA